MKKALIVCLILTVFMGMAVFVLYREPPQPPAPSEDLTVTFTTDLADYEPYMDTKEDFLILVNKTHKIGKDSVPQDLVAVKDARKEIFLQKTAALALEAMFIEMRAAGFSDVFVTSAYRDYGYQSSLFNTYLNQEMATGLSLAEAREKVLTYSAEPGTSEHQTGLAVDLMTSSMSELDESFADHAVYTWLGENAWKFGFILRFPEDKTDITGYAFEPWHYRFVGRQSAREMHEQKLCLEEYTAK